MQKRFNVIASTSEEVAVDEAISQLVDCFALAHKSHAGARKDVSKVQVINKELNIKHNAHETNS